MNKLVITGKNNVIYYGYFQDGKAVELYCERRDHPSILGNIYVGRVEKVAEGIHGAFVELSKTQKAFYKISSSEPPVKLTPGHEDKLYGGDLILVQVSKDAVKTKLPVVDGNVCLTGKYFVLSFVKHGLNISRKIKDPAKRECLLNLASKVIDQHDWKTLSFANKKSKKSLPFGLVIRTNACQEEEETLNKELEGLLTEYESMMQRAKASPGKTLLQGQIPYYIRLAQELPMSSLDEILTDEEEIYKELLSFYGASSDIANKIAFYRDDYDLYKLYRFDHFYETALHKTVLLKSGGSIVIEPTEAMVVIDVNSGSVIKSRKYADAVSESLNKEAATEIIRQLRLRNLSGMILVDFINMKGEESRKSIFSFLKKESEKDRIPIRVIDFTALYLVEMTRNKVRKSLYEQWKECHELPSDDQEVS